MTFKESEADEVEKEKIVLKTDDDKIDDQLNLLEVPTTKEEHVTSAATSSADKMLSGMMGDAPPCPTCGHITIRNGSCYKCLNCGSTTGCS